MILLALPQRSKFGAFGQMEDEAEKSGVPAKVNALGLGARGCAMTHLAPRNGANFP
jgi:hypothetical protein